MKGISISPRVNCTKLSEVLQSHLTDTRLILAASSLYTEVGDIKWFLVTPASPSLLSLHSVLNLFN